jgi:hypothetical protein
VTVPFEFGSDHHHGIKRDLDRWIGGQVNKGVPMKEKPEVGVRLSPNVRSRFLIVNHRLRPSAKGKTLELRCFGDLGRQAKPELSKARVVKSRQPSDLMGGVGESVVDRGHPTC